ncbi:hypothetical protein [Selenomonas sputigena]|nr:hypothetical protein [Selenomonas sputigena]UZE46641.1 hypothetical protein OL236_00105 [Selenomonas sputigena]
MRIERYEEVVWRGRTGVLTLVDMLAQEEIEKRLEGVLFDGE